MFNRECYEIFDKKHYIMYLLGRCGTKNPLYSVTDTSIRYASGEPKPFSCNFSLTSQMSATYFLAGFTGRKDGTIF